MIECVHNKWVLTINDEVESYDTFLVECWMIYNHFDEITPYIIYDILPFNGCIEKDVVGMNSQEFNFHEPTKFLILFMLGHETKFL